MSIQKLISKTILFILPFYLSFFILKSFYVCNQGDLFRLGYFTNNHNYKWDDIFGNEFSRKRRFDLVSEIDLSKTHYYDVVVIGDSFTEQDSHSYQDYLSEYTGKKILQLDRFYHENPLETLKRISEGDFFSKIKCKQVILQTVERSITERGFFYADLNKDKLNISDLNKIKNMREEKKVSNNFESGYKINFFSKDLIRLPLYNFYYLFSDNGFESKTFVVKTTKNLFNTPSKLLLFYEDDLDFVKNKCDKNAIIQTNTYINGLSEKLASKNIELISVISPDKYEVYYKYFENKINYPKPVFFDIINNQPKKYIYIDTKKVISNAIEKNKDIYYFDDTHWSAFAAKEVALAIKDQTN
ncbi:alginate O-acetyltransferase AlgX-related protein [Flavobacterium columnare]|uniref:alginate O-acetyltransferase AlgX-related protein n=1 Tax=Flavobacterium columnare TaxID=996 RepID=UPI004034692C